VNVVVWRVSASVYINSYNRSIDHTMCRMQHGVAVTWRFMAAGNAPTPGVSHFPLGGKRRIYAAKTGRA